MKQLLFVCTGNYYRSRFAEILFNAGAARRGLAWRATSRGTDVDGAGKWNVGPISVHAREALEARGVPLDPALRMPMSLTADDLAGADLVVAVCEAEHRPLLARTIPAWAKRVTYWRVEDLHLTPADEALAALEGEVRRLIDQLGRSSVERHAAADG